MKDKKQCLHNWHSVYYGSEWEVECSKCNERIWDIYNKQDALLIVNQLTKR